MKKAFLISLLQLLCFISFSQSETEPNNDFQNANPLERGNYSYGVLGNGDTDDFYGLELTSNANFYVYIDIYNPGTATATLNLDVFNSLRIDNQYVGNMLSRGFVLNEGDWMSETFFFCGQSIDSFYLKLSSLGELEYSVTWELVSSYPDDGYDNNTFATPSPFVFDVETQGSIRYELWGGDNFDTVDYFMSVLPAGSYDSAMLNLRASNNSCTNGQWIKYWVYKNNSANLLAHGYLGDNPSVNADQSVATTLPLNGFEAGDVMIVRFSASKAFGYRFKYYKSGEFDPDGEDNCCTNNAIPLVENEVRSGNVGEYDYNTDEYVDEYDMYRIVLPQDGAIRVFVKSRNDQCVDFYNFLSGDIFDKTGNMLTSFNLAQWDDPNPCGQIQFDTTKMRGFAGDTFYIRLGAVEQVSYSIRYEFLDAAVSDSAEAYNSPISTVIPIEEGQVRKGHVRFKKSQSQQDASDIYRFNMPGDGGITVYMKATYRYDFSSTNSNNNNRLTFVASNFTDRTPSNPPNSTLVPDMVYLDTFMICGLSAGTNYFTISSSRAYEYEVYYVLNDAVAGVQNDPEPNNYFKHAIPIVPNDTRMGRLRYWSDMQGTSQDNFDYYKTTTPYKGRLKIYIQATSTACTTSTSRLTLNMYKDTVAAGLVSSRDLMNASNIPTGTTVYDTIYTCIFNPDTAYIRLEGTQNFRYQFRYEFVVDTAEHVDPEPDNSLAQATRIGSGQTHVRYVGKTYNGVPDTYDYFKMVVHGPDSLKLRWHITSIGCVDNRIFRIWLYNRLGQLLHVTGYVLNAVGTLDAGQVVQGGFNWNFPGLDTAYIRFEGTGEFLYSFYTSPLKPSRWFNISGDTTACEGGVYTYKAINVIDSNVTFHWSLPAGGGTLNATDSIATVTWNANGNRNIQLYTSNSKGSSPTLTQNVIVNGVFPTQTPVAYNFARTLSTNALPPGATCQWYRNDTLIVGATDSSYYAALAGTFTVRFVNDCGPGPISNAIHFPEDAVPQTISFPHTADISMSPVAKAVLGATASSSLPVFYQKISGPCTVTNDTLFITGVGTIVVKAIQPGDDIYSPAPNVFDTITVIKGNQVITFDSIPDQILNGINFIIPGSSSSGLTLNYTAVTGSNLVTINNLSGSAWSITKKGAGTVMLRATQSGNANYNAAAPVERTFCIGVRTLTPITGEDEPCIATYQYRTQKIPGAIYTWTLSGGGILTTNNDTAWVQWQTPGTYTLKVKATSPCDPVYTDEQVIFITTSNNNPGLVSGMLPGNGAVDQQLPLLLSWIPGSNTINYDLFVWDSTATEPVLPFASNIGNVSYTLPKNALTHNRTYKWKIVAKNPCTQTAGPIQTFRIIPLPDLLVSDVQAPATATSGQTITVSWKVTNIGPGRTLPDQYWRDGIYFALDTVPHISFNSSPNWNSSSWSSLTANGRPLLLGYKDRPSALDSGQFYTNSLDFTLPLGYNFPVYVYVLSPNNHPNGPLLQGSVLNDTARAPQPIVITQAPTPDLRVDSVFVPTSTFSGSTINLTYKVKNYGVVTPAGGMWTDSVFISQNPLFDRGQCIPINIPKYNDSYYPNAYRATQFNNTQLNANGTVTKNLQVVIPNYIFGTWFIYVKTNASTVTNGFIYEGALNGNNVGQAQLQVYLTPTPKLTVNNLTVPVTTASTTQPIGVNWNVKNEGFRDNIERNRGHFLTMSTCQVPCGPGAPPNSICYGPSVIKDSMVFGGSYWIDRVYLSTEPGGFNPANAVLVKEVKHGTENSGLYLDPPHPPYNSYVSCPAIAGGNINVNNIIDPGAEFPKAEGFSIPSDLPSGNYYIYIYTNPTKTVWEYPGTPQISRSALPIAIQRPDATVSSIAAPPVAAGGQTITINYNVLNVGAGSVFGHQRRDRLYISNFSNFDGSAQLVGTQTFTGDLPSGVAMPHTFAYTIPPATTGNKYFYVVTNYDSLFRETNMNNNTSVSAVSSISAALPADLVVSSVHPADSVFTIFPTTFKYTVVNNGTGATTGNWTDSLFISCSPSFSAATSYFVAVRTQNRVLPASANYTDSFSLTIPKMSYEVNSCFPQLMHHPAYFYLKTNANNGAYEGSQVNNNIGASGSKVIINPLVDHVLSETFSTRDTIYVGVPFTASWKLKNIGYKPVPGVVYYYSYYDGIYFSPDSIANDNDVLANYFLKYNALNRNDSMLDTRSIMPPNIATGDYYMIAKTNYSNGIAAEKILSNNHNFVRNAIGQAKKIHVIRPLLPDLVDTIIAAPSSVAAGQPITVVYKITNAGIGVTFPGGWKNEVLLSPDFSSANNGGDRLLATRTRTTPLFPGESYFDTVTVTIPSFMAAGNYVLISEANSNNAVTELTNANNLGFHLLSVFRPDSTDLIVSGVVRPDTVYLGYSIDSVKWAVKNASGADAIGWLTDGVYLSSSDLFDSTAVLLGTKYRHINLDPNEQDTGRLAPYVTSVAEGQYNVIVKTDLLSNILEFDKTNNAGVSIAPIYVKAKRLYMDIPEVTPLLDRNKYYRLDIPDSLLGSTILVTLKTNDSLAVRNEMFMAGGRVPTPADYDYRYEIPNYGNQQIVMTDVTSSTYYIMVRCITPSAPTQSITLKAVKLPFAILNVHTNSGGNIGNVTVKIRGSLFRDSMIAKLSNGVTTIYSSAVYYTNSTQVFATFNLQGRPLGVYDVSLVKPDLSTAILANGFTITKANNGGLITGGDVNTGAGNGNEPGCDPGAASGLNSQLVVELIAPTDVLLSRPIVIVINYHNPTNFDIPAQTRTLYSEGGLRMSFTKEGVPTGTTSLNLEFTEPGGPPGIIRAGGSGTIVVHSRAADDIPTPNPVRWKLK